MGVSVASPVLSNEVLGHHDADLLKTKLVSNGGFQPPKLLQEEMAPSSIIKSLTVVDTDEFDDDSTSEDEKVMEYVKEIPITDVDERDKGTSDDWIPRHPELVRLTGRHPFNCEPPLSTLMEVCHTLPVPSCPQAIVHCPTVACASGQRSVRGLSGVQRGDE